MEAQFLSKSDAFAADDVVHLPPGHFQPPLDEAALLVPLYSEKEQLGALVLGRPVNGIRYSSEDVTNLLNLTDRIGEFIASSHRKAEQMTQIVRLAEPAAVLHADHPLSAEVVEDALRNLYDYTLPGRHASGCDGTDCGAFEPGAGHIPGARQGGACGHSGIDRKAAPRYGNPARSAPREWYPYLILRDAYIEEVSNREIMMRLYISEGTFNRTRRQRGALAGDAPWGKWKPHSAEYPFV